jgi:dGTPase
MKQGAAELNLIDRLLAREEATLSEWGFRSRDSAGRRIAEPPCPVRTAFQRDRDRIIHSKAFRRLKHKTQVFLAPEGDHFRTRLTHTLEVTQIARTIGRALGLNEDLIEAIGLGHDLGHTPFGHAGEKVLDNWCRDHGMSEGFQHHIQSLRVVEVLENEGRGLNLTREVLDGIVKHTKGPSDYSLTVDSDDPLHWEGRVVKISDRIAYVNHDLQDALEAGLLKSVDVPGGFIDILGSTNRERIASMVMDIIATSIQQKTLALSPGMAKAINDFKDFLFERVYNHKAVRAHDDSIRRCLTAILDTMMEERPVYLKYMRDWVESEDERRRRLVDYVAGMTDRYAIGVAQELLLPVPWPLRGV